MKTDRNRPVDIFFYGLYMDESVLVQYDVILKQPQNGYIDNYRLRIGNNATIIKEEGSAVYGLLCSLTHQDIDRLYASANLHNYVPEACLVRTEDGAEIPALCYVLLDPPLDTEENPDYYQKLAACMLQRGLPVPKQY